MGVSERTRNMETLVAPFAFATLAAALAFVGRVLAFDLPAAQNQAAFTANVLYGYGL